MIRCRAVFLDAGGVIVLPHRGLVTAALAGVGIDVEPGAVPRAHYRAVRLLDRDPQLDGGYFAALSRGLGVSATRLRDAVDALSRLADRRRSQEILWSEPAPGAVEAIGVLRARGIAVSVVTNSDGHADENLRDAGICQTGAGAGAVVNDIVDSDVVGSAKPKPKIFHVALQRADVEPTAVVHVGDMLSTDVVGARAAGIAPIHVDPTRSCRARDHRHIRSLRGIWRHIAPEGTPPQR